VTFKTLLLGAIMTAGLSAFAQAPAIASEASMAENGSVQSMKLSQAEAQWDRLLSKYVAPVDAQGVARFDYAALGANAAERKILDDYIAYLEQQKPSTMTSAEATAYWANLYNALTVELIVDNYPVESIRKIKSGAFSIGPWGRKVSKVEGQTLTLNNIEHDILRKQFPSPHIHYMVNCASIGCPNLKNGIWRAETLDADRDLAARAFINSSRGVSISGQALKISSIYKWFKEDFGTNKENVLAHLNDFADTELKTAINSGARIEGYAYDWALNE